MLVNEIQMKKVKAEKDWINRFKVGAQAAQAASRQKKLEKWQASEDWVQRPPTPGKPLRFRFPDPPRMGNAEAVADRPEAVAVRQRVLLRIGKIDDGRSEYGPIARKGNARAPGKRPDWKKAYVTLQEGHDIDFMGAD